MRYDRYLGEKRWTDLVHTGVQKMRPIRQNKKHFRHHCILLRDSSVVHRRGGDSIETKVPRVALCVFPSFGDSDSLGCQSSECSDSCSSSSDRYASSFRRVRCPDIAAAHRSKMSSAKAPPPPPLDQKAIFYMCLLALQFGIQPILTRRFTPQGITRSTVILTQEVLKFGIAALMLRASGSTKNALKGMMKRPSETETDVWLFDRLAHRTLDLCRLVHWDVACRCLCTSGSLRGPKHLRTDGLPKLGCSDVQCSESNQDTISCLVLLYRHETTAKSHAGIGTRLATTIGTRNGRRAFSRLASWEGRRC